jgi:hypothetical protein
VNSSGLVSAKNINSSTTITVKLNSNPAIYTTVNVQVSSATTNYTVDIQGNSSVTLGSKATYTAYVKNNGVNVSSAEVVWSLMLNGKPANIAIIEYSATNNVVAISANDVNITGTIYLIAKYKSDLTKQFSKAIEIRNNSLW